MAKQTVNNLKLGVFVIAALLILIVSLYLIGRNQSLFGSSFYARARFKNIGGLMPGNNVRFAGIQAGTVKKTTIINDSTVEVSFLIDKKVKPYIHKNSVVSIGTEGLMGNKVLNITPNPEPSPEVEEGDLLYTKRAGYTEEIMQTLSNTSNNIDAISEEFKVTIEKLNNSTGIWNLLSDTDIAKGIKMSVINIRKVSGQVDEMATSLRAVINDLQNGKGTAGMLLTNEAASRNLQDAISHINHASKEADDLMNKLHSVADDLDESINDEHGTVHTLLRDSTVSIKINNSLDNIEKGTASFNEDMEALKHNFLFRGYFRKQTKKNESAGQ
ncbi:MAG TPA: MlaD family protein [Flavipsychrobacter sp.]|nr:MlaD family protein [Flavipsychrobacter sp.]